MSTGLRRFAALFGAGLVGIAALYPQTLLLMARARESLVAELPGEELPSVSTLAALALVQPAIFLAVGVVLGIHLAPKLGLRSYLDEWAGGGRSGAMDREHGEPSASPPAREAPNPRRRSFARALPWAIAGGVTAGVLLVVLDLLFRPSLGGTLDALAETQPRTFAVTLAGILYGGVTEELIVRWGIMTLVAWLLWRAVQRGAGEPVAPIMWTAVVIAAVLFGALHLGAVAATVPLGPIIVVRTVLLNAVGGVIFGWLYWKFSLEAAMLAHAMAHVTLTAIVWSGVPAIAG